MFGIGLPEILAAGLVVGLLFGAKRLPELFKGVGEGLRELRKANREEPERAAANPAAGSDRKS